MIRINQLIEESEEDFNEDNYDLLLILLNSLYPKTILKTRLMKLSWFFFELGNLPKILNLENYSMDFEPHLLGGSDYAIDNNLSIMENDGLIETTQRVSNQANDYEVISIRKDKHDEISENIKQYWIDKEADKFINLNDFKNSLDIFNSLFKDDNSLIGFLYRLDPERTKNSIIISKVKKIMTPEKFKDCIYNIFQNLRPIFSLTLFYSRKQANSVVRILNNEEKIIEINTEWLYNLSEALVNHYLKNENEIMNRIISKLAGQISLKCRTGGYEQLEKYFVIIEGLWRYNLSSDIPVEFLRQITVNLLFNIENKQLLETEIINLQQLFKKHDLEITPKIDLFKTYLQV